MTRQAPELARQPTGREKLQDAALRLFAQQGYAETTSRQLAEAAGVSLGLIHKHFGGMSGLRTAADQVALDWINQRMPDQLEALISGRLRAALAKTELDRWPAAYTVRALMTPRSGSEQLQQAYEAVAVGVLKRLGQQQGLRFSAPLKDCARFLLVVDIGLFALDALTDETASRGPHQLKLLRHALLAGE